MKVLDGLLLELDYGQQHGGAVFETRSCKFGGSHKRMTREEMKRWIARRPAMTHLTKIEERERCDWEEPPKGEYYLDNLKY